MEYAIGIDIGGTNIKYVAVTQTGALLAQGTLPTEDAPEAQTVWIERVRGLTATLESERGGAAAIGIASPGLAAQNGRSIAWMQGRMEAVQGLDWTAALHRERVIPVLNDAQAALLGETWLGAATGCQDAILLTLGTGVGGGILSHGKLLTGHIGRAGHLGHICLNPDGAQDIVRTPGSLEDAIGECTLATRSQGRFLTTAALLAAYRAGDEQATAVWQRSVHLLACGLVSLINTVDPEVIILGGGIAQAGADLFDPLQRLLDRFEWRPTGARVRLIAAKLGEYAGAYGAAYQAFAR